MASSLACTVHHGLVVREAVVVARMGRIDDWPLHDLTDHTVRAVAAAYAMVVVDSYTVDRD